MEFPPNPPHPSCWNRYTIPANRELSYRARSRLARRFVPRRLIFELFLYAYTYTWALFDLSLLKLDRSVLQLTFLHNYVLYLRIVRILPREYVRIWAWGCIVTQLIIIPLVQFSPLTPQLINPTHQSASRSRHTCWIWFARRSVGSNVAHELWIYPLAAVTS